MRADIRLWTAIAIIGICGSAIAQGATIARFSLVDVHASENQTEILSTWAAVPGLASRALQTQLAGNIDPSDLKAANDRR